MKRIILAAIVAATLAGCASNPLTKDSRTILHAQIGPGDVLIVDYESSKNQDMTWTDPVTGRTLTITAKQDENLVSTSGAIQAQTNDRNAANTGKIIDLLATAAVPIGLAP